MHYNYKYCPFCKSDLTKEVFRYSCSNCNKIIYINPAPCVSVIPIKNNEILLSKRGVKPRKGTYDFIGGFVNVGETIKQAAIRETFEETGLKIKLKDFIGEYSEIYVPNITYTLCFTYTAQILEGKVKANDDISSLEWVKLENIDKLDLKGSFPSIKTALNDIVDKYLS